MNNVDELLRHPCRDSGECFPIVNQDASNGSVIATHQIL
jgi:hypothetical protein